jgi:glucosylceramidase
MTLHSRRTFLRQAAALATSLAYIQRNSLRAFASSATPRLRAWMTAGEQRFKEIEVAPWQAAMSEASAAIEIDPAQQFQSILGFGGAFTDASCYLLNKMDPARRQHLLEDLVGEQGLRLSVGRTCIGSSDYSRSAYTYDDSPEPDPELKNFTIEHDRACILPVLRETAAINPELFLFSSPWSPPAWMKAGNSLLGGNMRKHYFAAYAQYFVKFLEAYKAEGVHIQAVTPQNEVDADQEGRMPAALWGQEYEMQFVSEFLGPALREASLDTKIWLLDHNYNLWGRAVDELSDPRVSQYVDGIAWHGYVGTPDAMTRVHDAFPDKHAYWTEGGPDYDAPDYATDWAKWSGTFTGILRNWARTIVAWNLVLDEKGAPNIGPFHCGGTVTLNSSTGEISRSGQYWAFAHYSKAVRRGARIIATRASLPGIDRVAFVNPAGDYVLVLTNQGEEREVHCRFKGQSLHVNLPHNAVVTLQWS